MGIGTEMEEFDDDDDESGSWSDSRASGSGSGSDANSGTGSGFDSRLFGFWFCVLLLLPRLLLLPSFSWLMILLEPCWLLFLMMVLLLSSWC